MPERQAVRGEGGCAISRITGGGLFFPRGGSRVSLGADYSTPPGSRPSSLSSLSALSPSVSAPSTPPTSPHSSSSTVWYLDLPRLAKVPLVCGHSGAVTALAAAPHLPGVVASTARDGVLRVWQVGKQQVCGKGCCVCGKWASSRCAGRGVAGVASGQAAGVRCLAEYPLPGLGHAHLSPASLPHPPPSSPPE